MQSFLFLNFEFDLLVGAHKFVSRIQFLYVNESLWMRKVLIRDVPHQKLHAVLILLHKLGPGETRVLGSIHIINISLEDELQELLFIVD